MGPGAFPCPLLTEAVVTHCMTPSVATSDASARRNRPRGKQVQYKLYACASLIDGLGHVTQSATVSASRSRAEWFCGKIDALLTLGAHA